MVLERKECSIFNGSVEIRLNRTNGCLNSAVSQLKENMQRCGIQNSLVSCPSKGPEMWIKANKNTREACNSSTGLIPCGILPSYLVEARTYLPEVLKCVHDPYFPVFRLYDALGLADQVVGMLPGRESDEIIAAIEHAGKGLIIELDGNSSRWESLQQVEVLLNLAKRFPDLRIALVGVNYRYVGGYIALLKDMPNFIMAMNGLGLCGQLPGVVEFIGANRLFFASRYPDWDASLSVGSLLFSELSDSDREWIAHKTLEQFLETRSTEAR